MEHQEISPCTGVSVGDNPRQRCVQASAPHILSAPGDRGAGTDPGGEHEIEGWHVVRKRTARDWAWQRTDESRPAGGTSTRYFKERMRLQIMGESQCEPENFTSKIIFMSMFNDIVWDARRNEQLCVHNSTTMREFAERFPRGHWSFRDPGSEEEWYGTYDGKPDGSWNRIAEKMQLN